MADVLDTVRDYTQQHPAAFATAFAFALPGTYLFITRSPVACTTPVVDAIAKTVGFCQPSHRPSYSPAANFPDRPVDYLSPNLRLDAPMSQWTDKPTHTSILRALGSTRKNILTLVGTTSKHLHGDPKDLFSMIENLWAHEYSSPRCFQVAFSAALPGAFQIMARRQPSSWVARHQTHFTNGLHVLALIIVANQRISLQDLLVTALVMMFFEILQRIVHPEVGNNMSAAAEKLLPSTHSAAADADLVRAPKVIIATTGSDVVVRDFAALQSQDKEITRLKQNLTEVKTSDKTKEDDLKQTRDDLRNARQSLTQTCAEYSTLRDEMKTIKSTVGRDHQAIIYRKDIELFALRKSVEQKENQFKETCAKFDEIARQHKTVLELKDVQILSLQDRVAYLERQFIVPVEESPGIIEPQTAVQIKLLRVSGRNSLEQEALVEDKDAAISKLKSQLSEAQRNFNRVQEELRRAWDASSNVQNALNNERHQHKQTHDKLLEATLRLEDEVKGASQKNSPTRLPTIDEQDQIELEAMFNAAQQDNLRLYSELETADKNLRETAARLTAIEQELEASREHLRLEKAINEDMGTARPSLVHRVHYQRMEGQLKDSRDEIATKDEEIKRLKKGTTDKEGEVSELMKIKEAVENAKSQIEEQNEELKRSITALEATKEQLMLDHERLAKHRARERVSSGDHASARSSGATLITDPSLPMVVTSDIPLPARPATIAGESSILGTPELTRASMISNERSAT